MTKKLKFVRITLSYTTTLINFLINLNRNLKKLATIFYTEINYKMRTGIFLIFLFFISAGCFAQLDNSSLFQNNRIDTSEEKTVYIKIQNLNFMKNNEYSGPLADGFTLFGYQFNPQLGYAITKNLSVEGGIFLMKDFGNKNFTSIDPTFSVRYYKNDFKMVFGNIDGSINHQLIEPIQNFERVLSNRLESGAQFTLNKKYFDFDVWIDWQNMQYRFDNKQEKIWGGLSCNVLKLKNDKLEFSIPFQATILHLGGQIDTLRKGATKNWNYAVGFILKQNLNATFIKSIFIDTRYVSRINGYFDSTFAVKSYGDGLMANLGAKLASNTDILLSYWNAQNYYNEYGGFLYSSRSSAIAYPWYSEKLRELIIARITKKIMLAKNVSLTIRVEPYYDLRNKFLEYSYGFYISVDERFWLKKK
jgi:hypothetical protein